MTEFLINSVVTIPFEGTPGQTVFSDMTVLVDGVVSVITPSAPVEVSAGLFTTTITASSAGSYTFFVNSKIQMSFKVGLTTTESLITDIADESLGSWSWDKTTGVLTLLRRDGSPFVTFNVVDNQNQSSRELVV